MTGLKSSHKELRYIRYDEAACIGGASCLKVCPTLAIRIKGDKAVRNEGLCIGCGECIRVCQEAAVKAATGNLNRLGKDEISVALVTPVLYAQFPDTMPEDILMGLRSMGFQHTVDMSYFLEMFQYATEEFILRNKTDQQSPWPLISPVCPVVIRLIAFKFPSLMPHVLPLLRPVDLMARDVRQRIVKEYGVNENQAKKIPALRSASMTSTPIYCTILNTCRMPIIPPIPKFDLNLNTATRATVRCGAFRAVKSLT